ncbi:MAG: dipicolinate synthase subunit DpsA [Eubacteriales bacterium]|nr:dipicolinate synthase subunit DpsA [Eubacteriales bacterium]
MNQSTTLAVVGGDVRQAYLAELLHEAGHTVRTFALERRPAAGCTAVSDLQACLDDARAVILPMPVQMGDGSLNAPLANAQHTIGDVLDAIPAGTLTLAGAVPFSVHARAVQNGLTLIDYLSREELAIRNAVPAAFAKKHRLSGYRRQASCRRYSTRAAQNSRLLGGSLSCARASPKYLASTALSHLSHAR